MAITIAKKTGVFDYPSARKVHTHPTPLLGGIAVFCAFAIALFVNFHFSLQLKGIVIASFLLMLTGLADDIWKLSAYFRLIIQLVCSLIVIFCGISLRIVPTGVPYYHILNCGITIFWIIGITNALNFMDGMDGLASGIVFIFSSVFAVIAYQTDQPYFAVLNIALAGACLGFLVFNFHPAKIFLGDAGSSFLGFAVASLAVMGEWADNNSIVSLSIPILVLSILIFDMVYITISRIATKRVRNFREWVEYVGKDHLHHRLVSLGFTEVQAVLFIYFIVVAFAMGALSLRHASTYEAIVLLVQSSFMLIAVSILMVVGRLNVEKGHNVANTTRPGD